MIFDFSPETDYPSLKWHLPFHSRVFKWGDWETVWGFLMCWNDDCYLFHTGLLDGRNTLCINAFWRFPVALNELYGGLLTPFHTWEEGKRGLKKKKGWGFFNSSGMKSRLTSREISLFFSSLWFNNYWVLHSYRWEKACRIICALKYYNSFHQKTFFVTCRTGNR